MTAGGRGHEPTTGGAGGREPRAPVRLPARRGAPGRDPVRRAVAVLRRVAAALRAVLGAPDYERYVAHVRRCHPGVAPLTREEFVSQRLEARYSRPGARCC